MANVLILSLVFPPDGVSTAHIMGDLAQDLRAAGHNVVVVTTWPHYNNAGMTPTHNEVKKVLWGGIVTVSNHDGIDVFRVAMPKKGKNYFLRTLAWLWFHLWSTAVAVFLRHHPDVLLVPSPPLTIGLSAYVVAKRYGAPFIYNVQELYPDIAIELGVLRSPLLIRCLEALERFIYSRAGAITVISAGMRKRLIEKGVPQGKIHEIPNFVDTEQFTFDGGAAEQCPLLVGLEDKFIVSYAGNMGPAQGLEILIDTAALLQHKKNVHFVLMGGGTDLRMLEARAAEHGCRNITFLPYQEISAIPAFYRRSDLNVVALKKNTGHSAVPSKVYRIMACAGAILAIADADSDLASIVTRSECGLVARLGCAESVVDLILASCEEKNEIHAMGQKGLCVTKLEFSRTRVASLYHKLIVSLN